jgi:hypothetical protein
MFGLRMVFLRCGSGSDGGSASIYLRRAARGEAATRLQLFNLLGERVATVGLRGLVQERVVLPQLPAGMYWVSLEHQKGRFRNRLPLMVAD